MRNIETGVSEFSHDQQVWRRFMTSGISEDQQCNLLMFAEATHIPEKLAPAVVTRIENLLAHFSQKTCKMNQWHTQGIERILCNLK